MKKIGVSCVVNLIDDLERLALGRVTGLMGCEKMRYAAGLNLQFMFYYLNILFTSIKKKFNLLL